MFGPKNVLMHLKKEHNRKNSYQNMKKILQINWFFHKLKFLIHIAFQT